MGGREILGGILLFIMGLNNRVIIQTSFSAQKTKQTISTLGTKRNLRANGMGEGAITGRMESGALGQNTFNSNIQTQRLIL